MHRKKFLYLINELVGESSDHGPLVGLPISGQFRPDEASQTAIYRNINAAFLIALCGKNHPQFNLAEDYLYSIQKEPPWEDTVDFYIKGKTLVLEEIDERYSQDKVFRKNLDDAHSKTRDIDHARDNSEAINVFWRVFFPEGVSLFQKKKEHIGALRRKRTVRISKLNPFPINEPVKEILFTSNVLLTIPALDADHDELDLSKELKLRLGEIQKEQQLYWYDHPVQVGAKVEENEILYGLRELDETIAFEKKRGTVKRNAKLNCVLSVSVTHDGLQSMAKEYLEGLFKDKERLKHISLYAFTESETNKIVDELFIPAADHYLDSGGFTLLHEIIGVNGEYGRHYSFLKAISAFWQVLIDPNIRATFKIDLDQVFPQNELVKETGFSALEHFTTPLWGSEAVDHEGNKLKLGMIAGALVNQKDIVNGLFTPDVKFPSKVLEPDQWIFMSGLPQALSTESEMMARYSNDFLNGADSVIQRVHVTGGTCGILVDSLRHFRPFTPGFIGRAEDQAYLFSVLYKEPKMNLRYLHKDGLIMRHDKEAFAEDAIKAAKTGKLVGDYIRILLFSNYAKGLPWPIDKTKKSMDPFTGCFISKLPATVVYLRFALKAASFFGKHNHEEGLGFLKLGTKRLKTTFETFSRPEWSYEERYWAERGAWDLFYDLLDRLEKDLKSGRPFAVDLRKKARTIVNGCEVAF